MTVRSGMAAAHARLLDALADDLLAAGDAEVLATHPSAEARVAADALRQSIRRGLAGGRDAGRDAPRDLLRALTMRVQRENEP